MAAPAKGSEWKLARYPRGKPKAKVLSERLACHLRCGGVPPPNLAAEGLCQVVRQGDGGALHTCILASSECLYGRLLPLAPALLQEPLEFPRE